MNQFANQLFGFLLIILVMLIGLDFLTRSIGPRAHRAYRAWLGRAEAFVRRQITDFLRWAWREYSQFIVGLAVGVLATLYFTGHLH